MPWVAEGEAWHACRAEGGDEWERLRATCSPPRDGEEDAQREERMHRGAGVPERAPLVALLGQLLGAGESCTSGPWPGWGSWLGGQPGGWRGPGHRAGHPAGAVLCPVGGCRGLEQDELCPARHLHAQPGRGQVCSRRLQMLGLYFLFIFLLLRFAPRAGKSSFIGKAAR